MTKVHLKVNSSYFSFTFKHKIAIFENKSQKFNHNMFFVNTLLVNEHF